MFCQNCGTSVPEGQKFCANCGHPTGYQNSQPASVQPTNVQPTNVQPTNFQPASVDYSSQYTPYETPVATKTKKSNKKVVFIIIGVIVLLAAISAVLYFFVFKQSGGYDTHEDLISAYCRAFSEQDYKKIYGMFPKKYKQLYKEVTGNDGMIDFLEDNDECFDYYGESITGFEIVSITELDNAAQIGAVLGTTPKQCVHVKVDVFFQGGSDRMTFNLVLFKSGWYLLNVDW